MGLPFARNTLSTATASSGSVSVPLRADQVANLPATPFVAENGPQLRGLPVLDREHGRAQRVLVTAIVGSTATITLGYGTTAKSIEPNDILEPLYEVTSTITVRTAAELEAAIAAGARIVVPPGLGGLQLTAEQTIPNNFDLEIGAGSWVIAPPNLRAFKTAGVSTVVSAGTTFTGTLTEYASEGTLSSGDEDLADYDYAAIMRSGVIWQMLHVRDVSGSVISFFDGFAAAFTTAWKLHKVTPTCTNVRIKGLIKKGSGTTALARAVDIYCGVNIDLSGLKTQGFSGHASDAGVVLTGCYNVKINGAGDLDSGSTNASAWHLTQCGRVDVDVLDIDGQSGKFPVNFAICTDLKISGLRTGTGGRTFKLDTCYRVDIFAAASEGNAVATTVGILIHSTGGLGAPFAGAHYNIYGGSVHNVDEYGLGLAGNGAVDIRVFGGDYSGNNRGAASYDVFIGDGDGPVYLYGVKYTTKNVGTTVEFYEDGVRPYALTPIAVRQSGALQTVTATIGRVDRHANKVSFKYVLTVSNATGAVSSNAIEIDLPVAAITAWHTSLQPIGAGFLFDNSTSFYYPCIVVLSSTAGRCKLLPSNQAGIAVNYLGADEFTDALAASDIIEIFGEYDVA